MYNPAIFNLRSGVAAVAADGTPQVPGWVSGDLANLGASASIDVIFDLGPNYDSYPIVQIAHSDVTGSSGVTVTSVRGSSDSASTAADPVLNYAGAQAVGSVSGVSSAAGRSFFVRPMGRFLITRFANADAVNPVNAQAFVALAAYPQS